MKTLTVALGFVIGAAAGYGRHCWVEGYIKGRQDLLNEIEKFDKRYERRLQSVRSRG